MNNHNLTQRFLSKIHRQSSGCWIWTAGKDPNGYGIFNEHGKSVRAHRWSAINLAQFDISKKMVCHHCDNPSCVNPGHLFVGSAKDNANDRDRKKRTSLHIGHLRSRSVMTPWGQFDSVREAARRNNISHQTIHKRIKTQPAEYYYL